VFFPELKHRKCTQQNPDHSTIIYPICQRRFFCWSIGPFQVTQ